MKTLKNILISVLMAAFTTVVGLGGYTIYAANSETNYYSFNNARLGFDEVTSLYHSNLNQFFNDKMDRLSEILEREKFYEDPDFEAPEGANIGNYKTQCGPSNVSTFCVSMEATDLYIQYVETLQSLESALPQVDIQNPTASDLLIPILTRNDDIQLEIENSRLVLEATLSSYNEFRLAYPMHRRYEDIIVNMNRYKNELKSVRLQVARFPGKFIDATSEQCK